MYEESVYVDIEMAEHVIDSIKINTMNENNNEDIKNVFVDLSTIMSMHPKGAVLVGYILKWLMFSFKFFFSSFMQKTCEHCHKA